VQFWPLIHEVEYATKDACAQPGRLRQTPLSVSVMKACRRAVWVVAITTTTTRLLKAFPSYWSANG